MIDDEKHNINDVNFTDCADIKISNDAADGLITTSVGAVNSTVCSNNDVYGFINAGDLVDCADITISDDAVDVLIATAINDGNSMDCAENSAGGLIAAIKDGSLTYYADIMTSDDEPDELIYADYGNSTDFSDTNFSVNAVDGLMMLMG